MDVTKILDQLRFERDQIEEAILSLEKLAKSRGRRRGRPPKWMAEAEKRVQPQARGKDGPTRTVAA